MPITLQQLAIMRAMAKEAKQKEQYALLMAFHVYKQQLIKGIDHVF